MLAAVGRSQDLTPVCLPQRQREGDLMRSLGSKARALPDAVVSAVVVESAARFGDDSVVQLLHPQSAMNHLLSQGTSPVFQQSSLCDLFWV